MKYLRRFLVVQSLMLWQGGFLFYAAFVVPAGTRILGSPLAQGFITRRVTDSLNACGIVALLVCLWDLGSCRSDRWRWALWSGMLLALGGLVSLHLAMDDYLDLPDFAAVHRSAFYPLHRLYLWASTAQWLLAMGYSYLTVRAWAREDRAASARAIAAAS